MSSMRAIPSRESIMGTLLMAVIATCMAAQGTARTPQPSKPALLVFITIDQMRADYLDRFGQQMTGGLKRLSSGGAMFRNGFQDHAITETAPGHAATLSGRFPVRTGIWANDPGVNRVPDAQVLGGGPGESASPDRFRGTTLVDWLRAANPSTKWLSVSRKDRGAILPIGKSKGDVYWYHGTGAFTTSTYYAATLPAWVTEFNTRRIPQSYAGKSWDLLRDASFYTEPDTVAVEANSEGRDMAFPHKMSADPATAAASFAAFPWMDELTLRFALHGVRALGLGATANRTDLLAVSLSTLDAVGHRFGPDSREVHDQVLRVDEYLGAFLDSLEAIRGPGNILVALTSDHGVSPYPSVTSKDHSNAGAKEVTLAGQWRAFQKRLAEARIDTSAVAIVEGFVVVTDQNAFARVRGGADAMLRLLARDFMQVPGVLRADLMTDIEKADTTRDDIARRYLHTFSPRSNVRLIATLTQNSYWAPVTIAMHGSPHNADANVPVLFWGPGVVAGQYSDIVRVVDMAPTLAAILDVKPTETLDGRILTKVVR